MNLNMHTLVHAGVNSREKQSTFIGTATDKTFTVVNISTGDLTFLQDLVNNTIGYC